MNASEKEQHLNWAMEKHGDYIKRLIYTYIKDIHKAEDIVQEVFIKFYQNLDRFEGRSTIKTFLYRIAVNECQNYLNSWHYRKLIITEKFKVWIDRDSIESEYIQKEESQSIATLLYQMPVKYREVIWLYYYVELSVPEISIVLNCSKNTVKTRLLRGRKLLKITMEEYVGEYEYQK